MTYELERHLVLIETASNQRFIYDTNKLRDNIGASQLLHLATTAWIEGVIKDEAKGISVEWVVQLSGKAILLVPDRDIAKRIITAVTLRALKQAPGMVLRGVIGDKPLDLDKMTSEQFHEELKALFAEHERLGADLPSPDARFQRLPVVAPCGRSGLPASHPIRYSSEANTIEPVSAPSNAKEAFSKPGWKRIVGSIQEYAPALTFHKNVTEMETANEAMDWVGLIHADGNGLGRLFLNFDEHVGPDEPAGVYIERYRDFSRALDDCTRKAFAGALAALDARRGAEPGKPLPVVPMVLGGDDLTALCDGTMAVRLAADYVTRFMDATAAHEDIQKVWKGPLGVCAGVSLVKPHYPHHAAYELACDLLESAKGGKRVFRRGDKILPFAALDVHVHLDSSGDDLGLVRERHRSRDGEAALTVRPFVVRAPDDADLDVRARNWAKVRGWDWLERVMPVMPRGGGDFDRDARLPNSVLHDLCAAAQDGVNVANARLCAVLGREHKDASARVENAWARLLDSTDPRTASLFVPLPDDGPDGLKRAARLPDALDLMDFWR